MNRLTTSWFQFISDPIHTSDKVRTEQEVCVMWETPLSLERAREIFDVRENCTEQELRQRYRNLADHMLPHEGKLK